MGGREPIWLFDLDNTLHDASRSVFGALNRAMTHYIAHHLTMPEAEANALRHQYWCRYGATLTGLVKHHGVRADHFLAQTHELPGLEQRLHAPASDRAALRRLPGRKFLLTNAPRDYAKRVLKHFGMSGWFEDIISIESMRMFCHLRPKPDARMLKALLSRYKLPAGRCILVEDTLANQRTAHRIGIKTVWMQRYIGANSHGPEVGGQTRHLPRFVHAKMKALQRLQRLHV